MMIPNRAQTQMQPMTLEAFLAFCALPENADRAYERIDGEILEKDMADVFRRLTAIV